MIGLLRAEWMKAVQGGTGRAILATLLAVCAFGIAGAVYTVLTVRAGLVARQVSYASLDFPNGMLLGLQIVAFLAMFLTTIFVAWQVGNEYSLDTWKNLLIRHDGRGRFVAAKLVVACVVLAAIYALALLATQGLASAAHLAVAGPAAQAGLRDLPLSAAQFWPAFGNAGLPILLDLGVTAALAAALTVVTRSTVGGILLVLVGRIALTAVPRLLPAFADYTINPNLQALASNFVKPGSGAIAAGQSALVLALYVMGALAAAVLVFRRRDMAG